MPIRPFRDIPRTLVEWGRFFAQAHVEPSNGSVGGNQIKDKSVTFAKIQDVTPDRLLGRDTSPAGSVQELTVSGGVEFTGSGIRRSALTGAVTADAGSTETHFRESPARSVIGRSDATDGEPSNIVAGSNGHFLKCVSDIVVFDAIADSDIPTGIARDSEVAAAYAATQAGTYTATLTGCTTSPTGTIRLVRSGNIVAAYIPAISGTSNSTSASLTGTMPAGFVPARTQDVIGRAVDNGSNGVSGFRINTDGSIEMFFGAGLAAFTASGTKGISRTTLYWSID